nr:probable glutamate carboxypeptidase 2 [Tanacetum cinerariifolium]
NTSVVPLTLTKHASGMEYNEVVKGYHAYSPFGTAYDKARYVSHGREEDYRALKEAGVDVKGCISVVKGLVEVVMFTGGTGGRVERGTVVDVLVIC